MKSYIQTPQIHANGTAQNFDKYDIPYDVLWLDIEHTDGKRYFTWDRNKFPNPKDMQASLKAKGRKLVTIIDPHIKKDDNYFVSKDATEKRLFVLDKDSKDYEGWCWPGNSGWLDYLKPETRAYWSSCFHYDKYIDSTDTLYVWNDMNEPSVFTGPEITMPKDNLHYWTQDKTVEHRDVHNLYGTLQQAATYMGLLERQTSVDVRSSSILNKLLDFLKLTAVCLFSRLLIKLARLSCHGPFSPLRNAMAQFGLVTTLQHTNTCKPRFP